MTMHVFMVPNLLSIIQIFSLFILIALAMFIIASVVFFKGNIYKPVLFNVLISVVSL